MEFKTVHFKIDRHSHAATEVDCSSTFNTSTSVKKHPNHASEVCRDQSRWNHNHSEHETSENPNWLRQGRWWPEKRKQINFYPRHPDHWMFDIGTLIQCLWFLWKNKKSYTNWIDYFLINRQKIHEYNEGLDFNNIIDFTFVSNHIKLY